MMAPPPTTGSSTPVLSVVLPSFQEEENLRILLPRIKAALAACAVPSEIVVIDTMSPLDATPEVCAEAGVRCAARRGGNSFGDAYRTGIEEARGEYTVFMDSDGSHPPELIRSLFACRSDGDVIVASRYVKSGFTENSRTLVLMSRVLNWTYSLVLGIDCNDVSNSFKLYRSAQLRAIRLKCKNFDVIEEILFKLVRSVPGLRIREVPFTFKQRMFGKTKRNLVLFTVTYLFTLVRLRFFV